MFSIAEEGSFCVSGELFCHRIELPTLCTKEGAAEEHDWLNSMQSLPRERLGNRSQSK